LVEFTQRHVQQRICHSSFLRSLFAAPPPPGRAPHFQGQMIGYSAEPTADGLWLADTLGFLSQNKERRLKHILGVVLIVQHTAAHVEHHRSMSPDQLREGGPIAP
jgi:hypothetical protein